MKLAGKAFGLVLFLSAHVAAASPENAPIVFSQLPMELKPYAIAIGQRLQRPGKERVAASGTITYFGDDLQRTEAVRVTWQFPMKIRLDREGTKLVSDRNNPAHTLPRAQGSGDLIQTLLEDSVDGLFALQKDRISRRYLGSGFNLEGAEESAPGMDVILMTYPDNFRNGQPIVKSYWFDSSTKLLGVVAYKSDSGSATHIVIDDWRDISGEKFPFRIERWEDNKLMMRLILDSAVFIAGANDGTFGEN